MEKKQNKLLLASAVFGAVFVVCIIVIWIFTVSEIGYREFDFFRPLNETSVLTLAALQLLVAIITFSFVFNLIGWLNGSDRHILIAGILYILGLNLISASLCLRVYSDGKRKIKNKLLFYAMIFAYILGVPCIVIMQIAMVPKVPFSEGEKPLLYPITVYFLITIGIGFILNFIAWKTSNKTAKIFAGIAYVLGLFTLIPAILCFISCKDNRKLPDAV
jgi:hypothetical protein